MGKRLYEKGVSLHALAPRPWYTAGSLVLGFWGSQGSSLSSWSSFSIRQPYARVHQGWDLVGIPALLP